MTFWEHVAELRRRVIVAAAFVVAGTVAGYFIFPWFVRILITLAGEELYGMDLSEGFLVRMKASISIGFFLSLPVIVFEISRFLLPALSRNEKRLMVGLLLSFFILFSGGIAFALQAALPYSIQFLKSPEFFPENVSRLISLSNFLDFFMTYIIGFGLCFQFPIVIILVLKFKILPFSFFSKNFKYVVIVIFIVAAVITPPDVISQIAVALPMTALYALSLLVAKIFKLGREERKES
jgi:sec-independent protein translocase protein TatC